MKLRNLIYLPAAACAFSGIMGCTDEINNYEKQTPAEASNKVFVSEKYASLAFAANRTVTGEVDNLDTLVAKLVVNCTSPAGGDLSVRVSIDTLLVDIYNRKHESSYHQFLSNWIRLNRSTLTIPEGSTESDTLTVALRLPLNSNNLASTDGYIMPIRITSASGYDAQVDYDKRVSYLTLDVTQENGVGFVEGNNSMAVQGNADFTGCDLPLTAYLPFSQDVDIELEVDNSLIADINSQYGTDFQSLPADKWETSITFPATNETSSGHVAYKGDGSEFADGSYLVPFRIKSVTEAGMPVLTLSTDVYYLAIHSRTDNEYTLETTDDELGVKQTSRGGYSVVSVAEGTTLTRGNWSTFLKSGWIDFKAEPTGGIVIDLGKEIQGITGLTFDNNRFYPISRMSVSYADESLYAATGLLNDLGPVENPVTGTSGIAPLYFKFEKPITARYLGLNYIMPSSDPKKNNTVQWRNFYIYTQN